MIKICHTCYQHSRYDTRVFWKECVSLAKKKNYEVYYIVADGLGSEVKANVNIIDTGFSKEKNAAAKRIESLMTTIKKINPKIIHFHTPSLINKFLNKEFRKKYIIIYDAHEDSPKHYWDDTKDKGLLKLFRYIKIFGKDILAALLFDHIITVVNPIAKKFKYFTNRIDILFNYPIIDELIIDSPWDRKQDEACYVGGLTYRRGIHNMVKATSHAGIKFNLAGSFTDKDYEKRLKDLKEWNTTNFFGYVNRDEIRNIYSQSKIGLLNLLWTNNHAISQPIKMYEYMIAGIPIVYSDFPEWKKVLDPIGCGIPVSDNNVKEIEDAIRYLIENDDIAKEMGQKGKDAVLTHYNWSTQETILYNIYSRLNYAKSK